MTFPNNEATRLTEKIMERVQRKMNFPTHQYNPVYSAVWEVLDKELTGFADYQSKSIIADFFKEKGNQ